MANKKLIDQLVTGQRALKAPSAPRVATGVGPGLPDMKGGPAGGKPHGAPGGPRRLPETAPGTNKNPPGMVATGAAGTAAAGGTAAAAAQTPSTSTDPRDSTYWAESARLAFQVNQQRQTLESQGAYAQQDYDRALSQLAGAQPNDVDAARKAANRQGLFNSGTLGKTLGDIETAYSDKRDAAGREHDRGDAARAAAKAALDAGLPIDEAALYAESVDRAIERDANAPIPSLPDKAVKGGGGGKHTVYSGAKRRRRKKSVKGGPAYVGQGV